jgi:hypothetical protein
MCDGWPAPRLAEFYSRDPDPVNSAWCLLALALHDGALPLDRTPASRNRYVDFLRAASMLVVTVTWIVQVMPIFFIVGGYANGVSWRAARRDGRSYATLAREPLAPLGVAAAAAACRLGGDRRGSWLLRYPCPSIVPRPSIAMADIVT